MLEGGAKFNKRWWGSVGRMSFGSVGNQVRSIMGRTGIRHKKVPLTLLEKER